MPPAPPDSPVGRADGPVGGARRTRTPRVPPVGRLPLPRNVHSPRDSIGTPRTPRSGALEALLVDLGSQIHRGTHYEAAGADEAADSPCFHATGLPALDARLGGGFPAGRLSEICGASFSDRSSGRTSLALCLLAEALSQGVLAAWVDLADAFDPNSATETILARGGEEEDLDHLLWVRARSEEEALRSCDRLLQTEGFKLIVFDLFQPENPQKTRIKDVTWLRLARLAVGTRTTLVVLSNEPMTGSRAELVLEMKARETRFIGPPSLLETIETQAVLRRRRNYPTGGKVALSIRAEAIRAESESPLPHPPPCKTRRG
ncbi:MAG: hypothetical protein GY910_19585 [bacterium]|nr:hypothetical protein [Deltaproteobacteria bacterium]MCP4907184.1 hypothetical protein [bacterium]